MLLNRILYVSESNLESKAANAIQVLSMCEAFVENGYRVDLLCRQASTSQVEGLTMIKGPQQLVIYRIWLLYKIMMGGIGGRYLRIYGRSFIVQMIISILGIRSCLELHTNENAVFAKRVMFNLARKKNLIFVPISTPIVEDMRLSRHNYVIAHDGHANKNKLEVPEKREGQNLVVGYFGKLSERKGLDILKLLDQQNEIDINLNIYSPDVKEYENFSNNVNLRYIDHKDILNEMASMDVLLLPIKAVQFRDYSRYTSPLKLFEYASVGRTIILSDVPSMKDMNFPKGVYACNKDCDWISTLKTIDKRHNYNDILILSGIKKWSEAYSWNIRVKNIMEHDFS
jgi:glycosyltransferase involved in cell wall biosynthesis